MRDDVSATAAVHATPVGPSRNEAARIGVSVWLIAAVALVTGILIGFASGYNAGRRVITGVPDAASDAVRASDAADETPASGRTFTEDAVAEPIRVDPTPVVASEEPVEAPAPSPPPDGAEPRRAPPVAPAASGPGSLQVLSRPSGAQVIVNGRLAGRTPLVIPEIRSGSHDVRIELPGFRRWQTAVQVSAGGRARVAASLEQ